MITAQNVAALLSEVPEFTSEEGPEFPYATFEQFAEFLMDKLNDSTASDLLARGFRIVNRMLSADDSEIVNLAQVAILEQFAERPGCMPAVRERLAEPHRRQLDTYVRSGRFQ